MSLHKISRKTKDFFSRLRERGNDRSQNPANASHPQTTQSCNPSASTLSAQPSTHELGCAMGLPPVVTISPQDQRPVTADPKALCPPVQSSIKSSRTVNTPDHAESSSRLPSRLTSPELQQDPLQGTPAVDDSHSIQNAVFREGSFANAHNITIYNANMNDGIQNEEWKLAEEKRRGQEKQFAEEARRVREEERRIVEEKQAKKILEKLAARGMPGATLNSSDRAYAPRCNEDTRQTWRTRIVSWAREEGGNRGLFWLLGPAGVGKSAIAQTVAEELKKEGLLGAVFFFSRPNDRSDPNVVIPTLVYQLALLLPEYQRIIIQQLANNPLILDENRRSQFENLIIHPFLSLADQSTFQRPLLIVLDGLDECNGREAQCEFVEMISYHTRKEGPDLRLRWMVCSRPEPDLRVAFSSVECRAVCIEGKIEVDDSEAQEDARRILDKGFAEIRRTYPDQVTNHWPTEDQVRFIADRASGHLGFASFIVRFIGDKEYGDPSGQLDVCLRFLRRAGGLTDLNPLHALDLLYTQILSDIPTNILPATRRILGLFIFYDNQHLTVAAHANFLGLNQSSFYRSLQRLHSVVFVPPASAAGRKSIQIYHASFSDFLKDPARSGKFVLEEKVVPYMDVALSGLKWLGFGRKPPSERVMPELTWMPSGTTHETVLDSLCRFSFTPCWRACHQVPKDSLAILMEALEIFDFNLNYGFFWSRQTLDFVTFTLRLISLGAPHGALAVTNGWTTRPDVNKKENRIWHRVDDPYTFVAPFLEGVTPSISYAIEIQLGRSNPFLFSLVVNPIAIPTFEIP